VVQNMPRRVVLKVVKNQSPTVQLPEGFHNYDFAKLAKSERDPRRLIRLTGFGILQQNESLSKTAKLLKVERKTVRGWLKKFIKFGLDGLSDEHRSGRPPRLGKDQEPAFTEAVVQLQKDREGGRITGTDIQKLAEEKFNAKLSLDRIYTLLAQLKIVWITGRSRHPKTDDAAQEAFKKKIRR
jgi:putative transposase